MFKGFTGRSYDKFHTKAPSAVLTEILAEKMLDKFLNKLSANGFGKI